jgi:hypothetical protein
MVELFHCKEWNEPFLLSEPFTSLRRLKSLTLASRVNINDKDCHPLIMIFFCYPIEIV